MDDRDGEILHVQFVDGSESEDELEWYHGPVSLCFPPLFYSCIRMGAWLHILNLYNMLWVVLL